MLPLEGGGVLGLVHIGVLQWLEEQRIPVDRLSGTSVGALYASGLRPRQIRDIAQSRRFFTVFTLQTLYEDIRATSNEAFKSKLHSSGAHDNSFTWRYLSFFLSSAIV